MQLCNFATYATRATQIMLKTKNLLWALAERTHIPGPATAIFCTIIILHLSPIIAQIFYRILSKQKTFAPLSLVSVCVVSDCEIVRCIWGGRRMGRSSRAAPYEGGKIEKKNRKISF